MSIRAKLILTIFLVSILVAGSAGGLFYRYSRELLYKNAVNVRREDVRKMAIVVADGLEASEYVPIANYINKMKSADHALSGIILADIRTRVISATDARQIGEYYKPAAEVPSDSIEWVLPVVSAVRRSDLGKIVVRYDKKIIEADIQNSLAAVLDRITVITAGVIALGVLLGFVIWLSVSKRLRELVSASDNITAENIKLELDVRGGDEVAQALKAMVSMVDKLRGVDELKDDFVNNVSHELRSPLSSIKSYVEVLLEQKNGELTPGQIGDVMAILRSSARLTSFVDNMLDVAKIKAGRYELEKTESNLFDLAAGVIEQTKPLFVEKHIAVSLSGGRPELGLLCDGEAVKRVIINLVDNALKFTPDKGRISLILSGGETTVRCAVNDSGPGIEPAVAATLFQRFVQHKDPESGARSRTGTGLGLSICKSIIELHGGRIWIESVYGQGSAFIFELPRRA